MEAVLGDASGRRVPLRCGAMEMVGTQDISTWTESTDCIRIELPLEDADRHLERHGGNSRSSGVATRAERSEPFAAKPHFAPDRISLDEETTSGVEVGMRRQIYDLLSFSSLSSAPLFHLPKLPTKGLRRHTRRYLPS